MAVVTQLTHDAVPLEPPTGASDAGLRQIVSAFSAIRRSDDPDRILDMLVSTALVLAPASTVWAGWKCESAPLNHMILFDPTVPSGPPPADVGERLEAALQARAPKLAPGQPPFEGLLPGDPADPSRIRSVFPMSAGTRIGALVLNVPLDQLAEQQAVLCLLTERALAALELTTARQSGQRAEALAETLTQLAASYSDPELVLHTIVRSTARLLGLDASYVMLADESGEMLRVKTAHGITSGAFYESAITVDELFTAKAIHHRRVVIVRDLASHDEAKHSRTEGLRTTICAPMFLGDELIGVLMASHREICELSSEDRHAMMALADAAAVAIGNARLYAGHERSIAELAELNQTLAERSASGERAIAFQQRLTALVLGGSSLEELVSEMSEGIGCQVLILDRELVVLHASRGATPDKLDHAHVQSAVAAIGDSSGVARLTVDGHKLLVAPLDLLGARSAYVVVIEDSSAPASTHLALLTEAAVTAVGLELMRERASSKPRRG